MQVISNETGSYANDEPEYDNHPKAFFGSPASDIGLILGQSRKDSQEVIRGENRDGVTPDASQLVTGVTPSVPKRPHSSSSVLHSFSKSNHFFFLSLISSVEHV